MSFKNKTAQEVIALIKGKKVKVVSTASGHGKPEGTIITVKTAVVYNNGQNNAIIVNNGAWMFTTDIAFPEVSKAELEEELKNIKKAEKEVKEKLDYLKATKQNTFDETQYKVYNTLQVLKSKNSDVEKAKVIAELINQ